MTPFHPTRTLLLAAIGAVLLPVSSSTAQAPDRKDAKSSWVDRFFGLKRDHSGGWLFAASKEDGKDGVYFAVSKDGYHWKLVNDGRPIVKQSQRGELMRDPFVQRAPDGTFRMVWTWSTGTPAVIGYSTSSNLAFWTEQRQLPVVAAVPAARNAWAPAIYYEPDKKDWLILWSSTVLAKGNTGDALDNRIYATTTTEFKHFTPAKLFFDPGYAVAGATLVPVSDKEGKNNLRFTDERLAPTVNRIAAAAGPTIDGPWLDLELPLAEAGTEAPAAIPVTGGYLVYYDHDGAPRHYGAAFSADLQHWSDVSSSISLPEGMSHGSLLHLETGEYNLLLDYHQILGSGLTK
jgi:hypothetical protein